MAENILNTSMTPPETLHISTFSESAGIQLIPGPQGEKGQTGADGKSAYQIAIENGFEGTKAQWLASLKGEQGEIGPQGPQGMQGPIGPAGPTGPKGADGTMTFEDLTPEQRATLKGDKGDTGQTGATGATGPQGPQGQTGPQGPKGDTGETGATGPQGQSPFVYGNTAPVDTTKIWVTEDSDVEQIVYSDQIRKIVVVSEYPVVQESDVLYVKIGG